MIGKLFYEGALRCLTIIIIIATLIGFVAALHDLDRREHSKVTNE